MNRSAHDEIPGYSAMLKALAEELKLELMPKKTIDPETQFKLDAAVLHLRSAIAIVQTIDDAAWNGSPGPPEDVVDDIDAVIKKLGVPPVE